MSNIYLYFYKNASNFFFYDSKEFLDSKNFFDALISEVDLKTWQSDSENYPNPQFPLPSYIIEGFKGPMYELLKESADLAYDDLTKKSLKASVALFMLNDYRDKGFEEYDVFFNSLTEIEDNFNCLSKLLKTIDNINDLYEFQHSILPNGQSQRSINNICSVKKWSKKSFIAKSDFRDDEGNRVEFAYNCKGKFVPTIKDDTINNDSDLSTKDGVTSDED